MRASICAWWPRPETACRSRRHATEPGRILAKGVTTLYSVSILNTSRAALDTGTTLEAMAYRGDYWDQTAVTEGVTYTWRWADEDPSSYDFDGETGWHVVGGVTGDSFTVPEGFEGRWVSVSAYAGDNVVSSPDDYAAGPFKKPGTFELYTVGMGKAPRRHDRALCLQSRRDGGSDRACHQRV